MNINFKNAVIITITVLVLLGCSVKTEAAATPIITPAPMNADPTPSEIQPIYSCPPPEGYGLTPAENNTFDITDNATGEIVGAVSWDGNKLTIDAIDGQHEEITNANGGYEIVIFVPHYTDSTIVIVIIQISTFVCDDVLYFIPPPIQEPVGPKT